MWKEKERQAKLDQDAARQKQLEEELENHVDLIGASALEDQLQDKVPETIYDMT